MAGGRQSTRWHELEDRMWSGKGGAAITSQDEVTEWPVHVEDRITGSENMKTPKATVGGSFLSTEVTRTEAGVRYWSERHSYSSRWVSE
jgi:hypothetical protein